VGRVKVNEGNIGNNSSSRELAIYKDWFVKKSVAQIANEFHESEDYVRNTIKTINNEINTFEKSIVLLQEMGIIRPITLPKHA
jgi:hypothetical protein